MAEILVIAAHPQLEHSRATRCLMQAAIKLGAWAAEGVEAKRAKTEYRRGAPTSPGPAPWAQEVKPGGAGFSRVAADNLLPPTLLDPARVAVRDLYALYPDYFIDVAAEQAALAQARLVVWLHPVHWYSMPPLLKLWLDEVFAFGWAYGPDGLALAGKDLWLAASTGGPDESYRPDGYNRYFFDAFLHPYEQTAALCRMRWLPPLVMHGAHRISQAALEAHAATFVERLQSWPHWSEIEDMDHSPLCDVPADARPDIAA